MGFERVKLFKQLAELYKGEIDLNKIAIQCKEEAPKAWINVRGNCKKIWPGEQKRIITDPNTGKPVIQMYRPTDAYEEIKYSVLYCSLLKPIYYNWKKIQKWVDVDDYLDEIEHWICQTIRHYSPTVIRKGKEVKCSFKSLGTMMISNCAINLINRNTTIRRVRDKNKKIIHKEVKYHSMPLSLTEILDEPKNYNNYLLPKQDELDIDIIPILKEKYKKKKDFMTWALLDFYDNNSFLVPKLDTYKEIKNFKYNSKIFKKGMQNIKSLDKTSVEQLIKLGFTQEQIDMSFINFNNLYNLSIKQIKDDLKDIEMC